MRGLIILFFSIFTFLGAEAQETGLATFYGTKFNNRKTASGEIYRKDSMVCAHRTYPFGTLLRVRNLKNNKEVVVRVIDRGPFAKRRIVDLSHAAAKELDMVRRGVIHVEVSEFRDSIIVNQTDTLKLEGLPNL